MNTPADGITVLHVDDDPAISELAAEFLEKENEQFHVEAVSSASEAMDRIERGTYDCLVSDYDMPGQNGIEFLERIREDYPDLPFILFTGKGSEEIASEAISAGVTDYLQKETTTSQYAVLANRILNAVENYRAQRKLADREQRLNLFFEQSPLGVIEWDENFDLVRLNESATEILGYTSDELAGQPWERIVPESDLEQVDAVVSDLLENKGGYHSINRNVCKDGTEIVCEWHNRVITDADGSVVAIFSQFQDVTERDKRQQAIENLHQTAHTLLEADSETAVAEIVVAAARDILDLPSSAVHLYDEERDGLKPVANTDQLEELIDDVPTFGRGEGLAWEVFETGEAQIHDDVSNVEGRYDPDTQMKSEVILPLSGHGVLIAGSLAASTFDDTDVSLGRTLAAHATTALDQIERERRLKGLQRCTQTFMHTPTIEETATVAVETAHDVLGVKLSGVHLIGDDPDVLEPVAFHDTAREAFGSPPEYDRTDDGDPIAALVWDAFEAGEPLVIDDISDYDAMQGHTPARSGVIHPLDDYGVFIVSSTNVDSFSETDLAFVEIVATALTTALDRVRRERDLQDREAELQRSNKLLSTIFETLPVGVTVLDGDGVITRANRRAEEVLGLGESQITGRRYDDPQWEIVDEDGEPIGPSELPFEQVRRSGEPVFDVEHGIRWPDGSERWLSINVAPLESGPEGSEKVVAVSSDITEQRQHERTIERQNEQLGEFASIVSHDLRNPLNVATGRLELERAERDSEHLAAVARAHERMEALIEDTLALARQGKTVTEMEPVRLSDVVEACWATVDTRDATLEFDGDRILRADPSRLQQLLENLIRNAIDHGGDAVTVRIGAVPDAGGFYVEDDGVGVPREKREQIFDVGYTTTTDGTGFGLNIVEGIVDAHDWEISVTGSEAGGARFEITGVDDEIATPSAGGPTSE